MSSGKFWIPHGAHVLTPQPSGSGPPGRTPPTPVRSWEPSSSCFRGPHSGFRKHGFQGLLGSEIEGSGRDLWPPHTLLRAPRQPLPSLNLDGLGRYRRSSPSDVAAHRPAVPPHTAPPVLMVLVCSWGLVILLL